MATNRFNRNFKQSKQQTFFDFNERTVVDNKFAEMKRVPNTYYGIGKDRDTGRDILLDYETSYRSEAERVFKSEFDAMNADLVFTGVYRK